MSSHIKECPFCKIFRDANLEFVEFLNFLSEKGNYQELLEEYKEYKKKHEVTGNSSSH